jgi:translation initiation factor IF-1
LGTGIVIPSATPLTVTEVFEHRELHLQLLKEKLEQAQNRMKAFADKNRTDVEFSVGDQVLLKLQPYTQSSIANRPYPKLSNKFFGP